MAKALQVIASWKTDVYLNSPVFDIQGKVLRFSGKRKCLFVADIDIYLFSLGSSHFFLMNTSMSVKCGH